MIFYEYVHNYRTIHLNRKTHVDGLDFWNGDSIGRWEGNTLVVDVANFNGQTWLDSAGNFHSEALHVVERYTRTDAGTMMYEATIEDPKVFTRPWKIACRSIFAGSRTSGSSNTSAMPTPRTRPRSRANEMA